MSLHLDPTYERKNMWYLSIGVWLILVNLAAFGTQDKLRCTAEMLLSQGPSIPCPNILMTAIAQSANLFYSTPQTIAYLNFNYATSR